MKKALLFSFLFLMISLVGMSQKYHRINAKLSKESLDVLFSNGLEVDHFHYENGNFSAEVSDLDIAVFKKSKILFKYEIKDLEKNIAKLNKGIDEKNGKNLRTSATPSNFSLGSYGGFYTLQEMQNTLDLMRALYPNIISSKSSIGTTVEGRPVFMVKISDNPDVDENESELFLNAVHHAREPMSLSQLIYYMWHLLEGYGTDEEITTLINSTELFIVPMVNPDGYVYNQTTNPNGGGMWRKNRKNNGNGTIGVDINRNYGYNWGLNNTGSSPTSSSDTYRGTSAFSEPETQIIRDFCNSHDFVASMDFHSYGNYCIYPFGHSSTNNNPEIGLFTQLGAFLTAENNFTHGNATQTVNYTANGAGDDWKYGEQTTKNKIYSFTPEIGASTDGFYPAQSRIIPLCESTLQMNRKILMMSSKYAELNYTSPGTISSSQSQVSFSVQNFGLRNPSYIASLSSSSAYVTSIGSPVVFNNMSFQQNQNSSLAFTISPSTPLGTQIELTLVLDNGHSPISKTFTVIYNCATPINLTANNVSQSSAVLNWNSVAGASSYIVNYKKSSDVNWSIDILSSSNSLSISNLSNETTYNWRIKTNICSDFASATFTTLGACGFASNLSSSGLTSTSANLNWQAAANALTYNIEYQVSGASTWTVGTTNLTGTSYVLSGLGATTNYNWRITANCSVGQSVSPIGQFTTLSNSVNYCSSLGSSIYYFWIDNFKFSNITRVSGADGGYYNGTNSVANVTKGSTYSLQYSAGFRSTIYRVYWRVWIDYNGDGDFLDSGEQVLSTSTTGSGNYSLNINIPTSAVTGQTRMRIAMKYGSYPTSCETFTYGEVEDYTLNIGTISTSQSANARIKTTSFEESTTYLGVSIYPNPTTDEIYVDFKNSSSENMNIKIVDILGKEYYNQTLTSDENGHGIRVTDYPPSSYIIIFNKGLISKSLKFIKK